MKSFKSFIKKKASKTDIIPGPNPQWDKGNESIAASNLNSGIGLGEDSLDSVAGVMGHGLSQVVFNDRKKKKKGIDQSSHFAAVNQSPTFSNHQLNTEEAAVNPIIGLLNNALSHENACVVRYQTHASFLSEEDQKILLEIANDEARHARLLRGLILEMGFIPTTNVYFIQPATTSTDIRMLNMKLEEEAIEMYDNILKEDLPNKVRITIEYIISDERQHFQELQQI